MSEDTVAEYFVEVISNVSHANGVFRVTFAQQEAGSAVKPTTRLLVPANQLGRILNGLNNAAGEIGQKVRQQVAKTGGNKTAKPTQRKASKPATPAAKKAKKKK